MGVFLPLAYLIDWGWLRIGPPYIYINIDPVLLHLGPLPLRWYGLMYVVGIIIGLWVIQGYTTRKGITQDMVYRILWWSVAAGLIGGRLYFVIQQPNLVSYYLAQPIHIIATWEGGMAFFGAIFLVIPTIFWRARVERINPLVAIDAGVLFAAAGQIFGRIGNIINGDIVGYRSTLPWATIYRNPHSFFCMGLADPSQCGSVATAVQPAALYEMLTNIVLLFLMLYLARRLTRPGVLMLVYLYAYAITQFLLFFTRDNLIVSFLGLNWGLKQAQWTSLVLFLALLPITYLILRYSKRIPPGEVAATFGIPQKEKVAVAGATGGTLRVETEVPVAEEEGSEDKQRQEVEETSEAEVVDSGDSERQEREETPAAEVVSSEEGEKSEVEDAQGPEVTAETKEETASDSRRP